MFIQQQSFHQMITLGLGMILGPEASLLLTQNPPAVTLNATKLCWIDITLWDYHIHTDAFRALSWIIYMYFFLSDGESPRLIKNTEVELVLKPRHPTLIVMQPFLPHCSCRSSYFSNLC